tara:strand:- start:10567 stop:11202 length:636 start_codon:yes stop_codon:yes gene_type:complete
MQYQVESLNVTELKEYENNPRINKKSIEKVADSIRSYGWKVPIVVDEDMIILAGHTRLGAAKLLGIEEVPVHIAKDLSEEQKTAFRIMDNKSHDYSEWDNKLLGVEFEKLLSSDFQLDMTGFNLDEINKITDGVFLEFDSPDLEMTDNNWQVEDVHIPETNVKQFMLLFNIADIDEIKKMVEVLRDIYKIESPSDIIFEAVKNEYKKNTNL